jgi:beta-lactam-binding protein with PASTA domain
MDRGPAANEVPDLIGLLLSQAREYADGLQFGITTGHPDDVQMDGDTFAVTAQEPRPGALVHMGTWIKVDVEPLRPDDPSGVREPRHPKAPHPELQAEADDE